MENVLVKEEYFLKAASKEIEIKNINGVPYFFIPLNEAFDGSRTVPQFDINTDYVKECEYLKSANESLVNNIEQIGNEIKEIKMSLVDLEKSRSSVGSKKYVITKKRDRRKSGEISRMFSCELCGKSYGSEGSLNHHLRLKHLEYFQEIQITKSAIVMNKNSTHLGQ